MRAVLGFVCALALAGCGGGTAAPPPPQAPPQAAAPATLTIGEDSAAKLAQADALDGAVDHVVAHCPGCNLGMEGDAAYALHAGDYVMHFCSDTCRDHFAEQGEPAIAALALPEAEGSEPTQ